MINAAAPRSITKPRRLTLVTLAACLMLALSGALTSATPAAASPPASMSAYQGTYGDQTAVFVSFDVHNYSPIEDGTCDMRMYKAGRGAIGEVSVYRPSDDLDASCFFVIPIYNLTYGSWTVQVHFHSDSRNIDITEYDSVGVTW